MLIAREDRDNLLFDGFVRHHFAANLREARKSAFDIEKAILVESADIAGLQPAVLQDFRGLFGRIEIAFENIWPTQPEHSSLMERFLAIRAGVADFGCYPRQKFSSRAESIGWLNRLARLCR